MSDGPTRPLKGHRAHQRPANYVNPDELTKSKLDDISMREHTPTPQVPRDAHGRIMKGFTLNPNGTALPTTAHVHEARKLAQTNAPRALKRLLSLLDSEDERVATVAAKELLTLAGVYKAVEKGDDAPTVDVIPGTLNRATLIQMLTGTLGNDK